MRFDLERRDIALLNRADIPLDPEREYTEDEALDMLEQIRDIEASYAQDYGGEREKLYFRYGDLADKIQSQIPED